MGIAILVEPNAAGFRATTGGPLDLTAEAASAAEAVTALERKIASRFENGAILIENPAPAPRSPIPVIPLATNPLFDEWLAAVEAFRAQQERSEDDSSANAS